MAFRRKPGGLPYRQLRPQPLNTETSFPQFFGDEAELWFDGNQDAELVISTGGYQTQDIQPQIEDAWDHFTTDDDDQVDVVEFQLKENLSPVEDPWDWFVTDDDDYAVSEDYAFIENIISIPDAWDWATDDAWDHTGFALPTAYQQVDVQPQIAMPSTC